MKIVNVKLDEIRPYENNPRVNAGVVDSLAAIIREFGFRNPAVLNRDKVIIEGHTRLLACRKLGLETMPCIIAEDQTEEQERALRIADNKIAEMAEWDDDKLKIELDALQEAGFDLSLLAFGDGELDKLLGGEVGTHGETEPDAVPDAPEVPDSQPGTLYALGAHLLLCGDATKAEDVKRLCGEGEADLWLTDPPYNVAYEGSNGLTIRNDSMEDSKFREFLRNAFGCAEKAMKPGAAFYVFHADSEGYNFRGACFDVGLRVRECLVWKKNALVLGRQDYQWRHEACIYGWTDGGNHYFVDDRTQATVIEDKHIDINKLKKDEMRDLLREIFSDKVSTTVIDENKPAHNADHPTMKPLKLLARLIKNSSRQGDIVLDTFGGSGSTLITCEQLGRSCYTMELDPKYADVIVKRWLKFTGADHATLQRGGKKMVVEASVF